MSGLLRRIKRSRPADAGEPSTEGQAAAPEGGAASQGEPAPIDAAPGAGSAASTGAAAPRAWLTPGEPTGEPHTAAAPAPAPATPRPVLVANPDAPAGLELEHQTTPLPPAGRRGRLRRRLRYLRRARELMLRDLGGLLYEVHRSGGGNVEAHATVLTAKVQRISGLDAEAHALETALASPRPDALVFEPGIGGTCPNCGELFSSAAHFCTNCGASVTALPTPPAPAGQLTMDVEAATPAPAVRPFDQRERRRFWQKVVGGRKRGAPAPDEAATEPGDESGITEAPTRVIEPAADDPATTPGDDQATTAVERPAADLTPDAAAAEDPAAAEPTDRGDAGPAAGDARTDDAPAAGAERAPHAGERSNGAGGAPPEEPDGDPLVTRRSHS